MAPRFNNYLVALLATAVLLGCPSPAPPAPGSDSTPRPQGEPVPASSQPATGSTSCSENMVFLPAVAALLGTKEPTEPWMGLQRRVEVPAFCMDVYEHPNQQGSVPTVSLRWQDADALCRAADKRLCTADEWERACRGVDGRRFGYGEEFRQDICNTPLLAIGGPGPSKQAPLAGSGSHPGCHTPEGIFDLDGNVSEYVSDPWDADRYGDQTAGLSVATFQRDPTVYNFRSDTKSPNHAWHTLRGSTMWQTDYGNSCLARHGHPDSSSGIDDGFRCCSDPRVEKQ